MSFTNVYYKRAVGTAKACYVCYKPTTTVLATIGTVDFLYTCPGHLSDRGFASNLGGADDGGQKIGLNDEEIAKIKEEWEQKQKIKKEREKEKAKEESEIKDDSAAGSMVKDEENRKERSKSPKLHGSLPTHTPPAPSHEKYALHRDYFAMRQAEHRKRRQAAQAKELAPRLPGAPRTAIQQDKY